MKQGEQNKGFDRLAPVYDWLAGLVYGNQIRKAQSCYLHEIEPHSKILVIGGGTGWILSSILQAQPQCSIYFVEASQGMIKRAMKVPGTTSVAFINGTVEDIPPGKFDFILLPFFLDMFLPHTLSRMLQSIAAYSSLTTQWLVTDFIDHGKWWERLLLATMFRFFRLVCNIEAHQLSRWPEIMTDLGFAKMESQNFYGGFIASHRYNKK